MNRPLSLLLSVSLFCSPLLFAVPVVAVAQKADTTAWQQDLDKRHAELIERNGPGTDTVTRDQLLAMGTQDQDARGIVKGAAKDKSRVQIATNVREIDASLTAQLKVIVTAKGWPTIAMVGLEASNAAMLVLTHTQDHAWQLSLLPRLESLADQGKIDGSGLAIVIDKELVSEGKLQRYGTQFKAVDGGMAMFGVENPGELDAERAKVGLPPMDVYKQQLAAMYHLKATGKVVMATAPAPVQ